MRTARIEFGDNQAVFDQETVIEFTKTGIHTYKQSTDSLSVMSSTVVARPSIEFVDGNFYLLRNGVDDLFINGYAFTPSHDNENRSFYPIAHEDTITVGENQHFHFFEPADCAGERYIPVSVESAEAYATEPLFIRDIKFITAVAVFGIMHKQELILSLAHKFSRLSQRPTSLHPFSDEEKFTEKYAYLGLSENFRDEQDWLPMKPPEHVPEIELAERIAIHDRMFTFRERVCLPDVGTICYVEGKFLDGTPGYQYAYVLGEEFEPIYEKFARQQTVSLVDNHYAKPFYTGVGKPSISVKREMISGYQISSNNSFTVIIVA